MRAERITEVDCVVTFIHDVTGEVTGRYCTIYARAPVEAVHESVAPDKVMPEVIRPAGVGQFVWENDLEEKLTMRVRNRRESNFDFIIYEF